MWIIFLLDKTLKYFWTTEKGNIKDYMHLENILVYTKIWSLKMQKLKKDSLWKIIENHNLHYLQVGQMQEKCWNHHWILLVQYSLMFSQLSLKWKLKFLALSFLQPGILKQITQILREKTEMFRFISLISV